MANPNFSPNYTTDEIYRGTDMSVCLTDELDRIDGDITGKANSTHTHTEYAETNHTHTQYANASHEHSDYANANHTHNEYAPTSHGHSEYAASEHTHDYAPAGHTHTGFAPETHTHSDYAEANHEHTGYATEEHTHTVFPSASSAAAYKLVYIATNGSDNNDGFTQATAMATIKGVIKKYADAFKALDIRLLDGTYTEDIWSISVDQCNLSIRSASENKDACILNIAGNIETNVNKLRLYNMTINVTDTNVRAVSVTAGSLYAYNVRFTVPTASDASCVNVYNGSSAFLMNCILNAGTGNNSGAAVYGNQALLIKAINCTSERTNNIGFHAHNGTDIWYTNTITAKTVAKETYYGKCIVR